MSTPTTRPFAGLFYDKGAAVFNVKHPDFAGGAKGDGVADDTAAIQAAIDAAGSGTVLFPPGTYLASGLTVSGTAVSLVGAGPNATRLRFTNTTGTLFTITGALLRLDGFEFDSPSATHTAGAVFDIQAGQGAVNNVRFNGNFFDIFKMESNAADNWWFDKVRATGGWTCNSLWRLKTGTGTVADTHIINPIIANTSVWTEAVIVLDTGVDTFRVQGGSLGGIGKVVWIRDNLAGQDPRFIRFQSVYLEGDATTDLVTISAGDDIRFQNGYFGVSLNAAVVNGGRDIRFAENHYVNIQRRALHLTGGSRVAFEDNTVLDTSQEGDQLYSSVEIAASVQEWRVKGNTFRARSGATKKPLRPLTIGGGSGNKFAYGANDWGVAGTDYGAAGDPAVSDGSTGTNVIIEDSIQTARHRGIPSAVSHTGSTTETTLATVTIPAGALRTRDGVRIMAGGTTAGTAGIKTLKLYFGTSIVSEIAVPAVNTDTWVLIADVFNFSLTAQGYVGHASRTPFDTEGSVVRNKAGNLAIATTSAVEVKVTGTLANTGDTIVLRSFHMDVVRR